MLSGFFDLLGGSTDSKKSYKEHVIPIDQHAGRTLTYTDCFTWLNRQVMVLLQKFHDPQVGSVKYIGTNEEGKLCAGIEFVRNVGGMSGKVQGQKLFKCKHGHGLLIPVEYVRLLSENAEVPLLDMPSASQVQRTRSVPNLGSGGSSLSTSFPPAMRLEDYVPVPLPGLKVGDNVVWLGGDSPQTGIVRWIGRAGRSYNLPIKVWMEMDDYVGYGVKEIDMGVRFGCASGRGRLLPADELILLENFVPVPQDVPEEAGPTQSSSMPEISAFSIPPRVPCIPCDILTDRPLVEPTSVPVPLGAITESNLIDFSDLEDNFNVTKEGNTLADKDFRSVMRPDEPEPMDTEDISTSSNEQSSNPLTNGSSSDEFKASAPPETPSGESKGYPSLQNDLSYGWVVPDANGNEGPTSAALTQAALVRPPVLSFPLVQEHRKDYLPPFIVPPIDIVDFFRAEGPKGIQGKRNSCFIDVVLFSMFAFSDAFDPYFLVVDDTSSKIPDNSLTKTAKKILAEQIVNPLRQSYYCPAAGVNCLRELMLPFSDKLDGAFMDVEEFMLMLFDKVFHLKEFISYDNNVKDYLHQMNLGDHSLPSVITLQQCLELSLNDYNLKLSSIPTPAFIIEIPRHHTGIIQSTTIVPNLSLNLDSLMTQSNQKSPSVMNLVAILCINEFHFVAFVKCGKGKLSHWVMFDSNPSEERPRVEMVTNVGECLESLEYQTLTNPANLAKVMEKKYKLPPLVQKMLTDQYVLFYV